MSRGKGRTAEGIKRNQISISVKVSAEEKRQVLARCRRLGCDTSELVKRSVFGRAPVETTLMENARAHLATAHAVRARAMSDAAFDPQLVEDLIAVTRALIAEVRGSTP